MSSIVQQVENSLSQACKRCQKSGFTTMELCRMCFYYEDLHQKNIAHSQYSRCPVCVELKVQTIGVAPVTQSETKTTAPVEETAQPAAPVAPVAPVAPTVTEPKGWFSGWLW